MLLWIACKAGGPLNIVTMRVAVLGNSFPQFDLLLFIICENEILDCSRYQVNTNEKMLEAF